MKTKPILRPDRLRHVPPQFSWIDQRLVRERHIARCTSDALALYLLLVTVADAQGLSYYSDATASGLLSQTRARLRSARAGLVAAGLVAYRAPYYQVLSLGGGAAPQAAPEAAAEGAAEGAAAQRTCQTLTLGDILRAIRDEPNP